MLFSHSSSSNSLEILVSTLVEVVIKYSTSTIIEKSYIGGVNNLLNDPDSQEPWPAKESY